MSWISEKKPLRLFPVVMAYLLLLFHRDSSNNSSNKDGVNTSNRISNKHCIQAGLHDGLQGSIQAGRLEMIKWDGIEVHTTFQGIH